MAKYVNKTARTAKNDLRTRAAGNDEKALELLARMRETRYAKKRELSEAKENMRSAASCTQAGRSVVFVPEGRGALRRMSRSRKTSNAAFSMKEGDLARAGRMIEVWESCNGGGKGPILPGEIVTIVSAPYKPDRALGDTAYRVDILRGSDDFVAIPLAALRPIRSDDEE